MHGIMQLIAKACTVIVLMLPYCNAKPPPLNPWNKMSFYPVAGSDGIGAFDSGLTCPLAMSKSLSGGNVVCSSSTPEQVSSVSATFPCVPMEKVTITATNGYVCTQPTHGLSLKSIQISFFGNECTLETMGAC
eukprot:CFRG0818T1